MTQTPHYRKQIHKRDVWKEKPEDENITLCSLLVKFSCFYITLRKVGFYRTTDPSFSQTPHKQIGSPRAMGGAQFGLSVSEGAGTAPQGAGSVSNCPSREALWVCSSTAAHLPKDRPGWPRYSAETESQTFLWPIPIPLTWQGRMKGKAGSRDFWVKGKRFYHNLNE